jgi:hypothetical protein
MQFIITLIFIIILLTKFNKKINNHQTWQTIHRINKVTSEKPNKIQNKGKTIQIEINPMLMDLILNNNLIDRIKKT